VSNDVITLGQLRRSVGLWRELRSLVQLTRTLRRLQPDIVHTHMAKAGVTGRLAAVMARVPVRVHTFHGHLLHGYFSPRITRIVVTLERALRLITTHAVVVGHGVRRDLLGVHMVTENHSSVINPGIDPLHPVDATVARRAFDLPITGAIVMYVGRFAAIKRPDRFVALAEAFATDAHFVMVGNGPQLDDIKARAGANVTFLDWQRDLATLLSAADVVVMCSDNEGVPLLLLEAAMVGRAALSTNVGSVSDVIDDGTTGLLVDNDDPLALQHALSRLLENDVLRNALATHARERALVEFAAHHSVDQHGALYRQLVATRGARATRWARRRR
jgi:glycosyltransferase involved in cell wall biosynthesis